MDICPVQNAVSVLILSVLSGQDIKYKQISGYIVWIYTGIGILISLLFSGVFEAVLSAVPGILFILLGKLSYEQIGIGDGITILALGIWVGCQRILFIIILGTLLCGVLSIIMLLFNTKENIREKRIAFIPFLLVGLVVSIGVS